MTRNFMSLLQAKWDEGKFVCVGLDSKVENMPMLEGTGLPYPRLRFNRDIIQATCDIACAFKPNLAFYLGDIGKRELSETIRLGQFHAPSVPWILDAKYGDIGTTNDEYVRDAFDYYGADAVTIHSNMGRVANAPFLNQKDKGIFVLCKTSNPGSDEFQDLEIAGTGGESLYEIVASYVAQFWNTNRNCGVVAGATYPHELAAVRERVGDMPILIPGIGAQGGDLKATVQAGKNSRNQGMIINSSRGIIFASSGTDFAEAARSETLKLHEEIQSYL